MRIIALAILGLAALVAAKVPLDAVEAHKRADTVLYPRMVAAANEWAQEHPKADDHFRKFDKPDAERWKKVREAFHELDDCMKQAGY